ncbi:SRPBCC family protein [Parvibium lacunae]|uniref:Coenzyme Q-binding protein COQ10 START domain-containing protein n=1 Tax=Parvibium lacunae TaxID=1888893 RepID=A0A368KZR0_9BURK|nr:SRPBCC family protein [Parvibium lacunae]RCS56796.1 hypothetical protein DU000_10675 [Parvibium lacunae]
MIAHSDYAKGENDRLTILNRRFSAFAFSLLSSYVYAQPNVAIQKESDVYDVQVSARLAVNCTRAWSILTDYDRLAEWVPDMSYSKRINPSPTQQAHARGRLLVAQTGRAHFLFFGRDIQVRLWITALPPSQIDVELAEGDFEIFSAQYLLQPTEGQCELRYTATVKPRFFVPPFIGTTLFKHQLEKQFAAIVLRAEQNP